MAVLAAPQLDPRQNDVPDCEDGGHAEHLKTYNSAAECKKACYLREQTDNDNYLGVCKGQCKAISHMSLQIACHAS
ncbi:hypothetical protein NXS19_004386 [Fusarium pseudograminearum]|nr:hypothetical protein NXS19_004386 [Fusarium pseudograminearum]